MSLAGPHQFQFASTGGLQIVCSRWTNGRRPRGIVQIAHGMGEHVGRYLNLIETLVNAGLVVYGNDHRGHGRTAPSTKQLGDFGPGGFNLLVEDMIRLSAIAKEENPGQPLILLGHSLGSFAAQKFALDHGDWIEGLVLSGSGALDVLARSVKSASLNEGILNARFLPARTPFDWLSRDPVVADAFMSDPLCFEKLQPTSMESFLAAGRELADPRHLHRIRPDLPIYLVSGSEDPIGLQLKGVRLLMERYKKAGVANVSHHFYAGGRHEMLNETNRREVITNLIIWISEVLKW
jgi:alpha-beta hydrolase superfamily lysophospholipase